VLQTGKGCRLAEDSAARRRGGDRALEVRGLTRRYGAFCALDGLDLVVAPGEAVALLGANGSGKTTALRCIAGELTPSAGSVRVRGGGPACRRRRHRRAARARLRRRHAGVLP
jgi:ABC-type multidrug transport system ATPase subunit